MSIKNYSILGLDASRELVDKITKVKKYNLVSDELITTRFSDGEFLVKTKNSVRGKNVFIFQSTSSPVNENLMELLITIDAVKRGSAKKIYAIIPYFGYARQDRKAKGRQPITCKLVADMLTKAGADSVLSVDIHSPQSMGFFDVPMDNLKTTQLFSNYIINTLINNKNLKNVTIVSPDHGGLTRVRSIVECLGDIQPNIAVIDKRRPKPNKSEVEFILGDVKNKVCFILDDMIDTGGTIANAARAIKEKGAKQIYILACHGVFSGDSISRMESLIRDKVVEEVVVTDTIQIPKDKQFNKLKILTISDLLANIIETILKEESITSVYKTITNELRDYVKKTVK
ncbi:ribose-phosphate pyrophosphokinase [Spiroplasma endosymbiont of Amphibalanus improvisus]|uniref:ribose-phosphate diphosphokinase n=1 Tax=Spiroplasma endosymbiont of Amphibalanus improvisus TaxID=3066327 RepID=UPI00313D8F52